MEDFLFLDTNYTLAAALEKQQSAYAKTKAHNISAFVFAPRIVQYLFFLNLKFQAFSLFLGLYSLVRVRPGRKPRLLVFSYKGSLPFLFVQKVQI